MEQFVEQDSREAIWENLARVLGVDTRFITRGRKSDAGKLRKNAIKMLKKARRINCNTIREYFDASAVFRAQKILEGWTRETIVELDDAANVPPQDANMTRKQRVIFERLTEVNTERTGGSGTVPLRNDSEGRWMTETYTRPRQQAERDAARAANARWQADDRWQNWQNPAAWWNNE